MTEFFGFDPTAQADAAILVLGTAPSVESSRVLEYYAHPRNCFWWIMGELVRALPELEYERRHKVLTDRRIAVWDVCRVCHRENSSDSSIRSATMESNALGDFLDEHPGIKLVCFNGKKAARLCRKLKPEVFRRESIRFEVLDSTSPAHARIGREEKFRRWRAAFVSIIDC
jgi:hypoxanthine-DNA glycosylase